MIVFILFNLPLVLTDGCLPGQHLIPPSGMYTSVPGPNFTTCSVLDTETGGLNHHINEGSISGSCNNNWGWWETRRCRRTRDYKRCECTSYGCESGNGHCFCAMSQEGGYTNNRYQDYCFQKVEQCEDCPALSVRRDCGCINNGTELKSWNCYTGFCSKCPKGHMCPEGTQGKFAIPCPEGTYQDEEGMPNCKICQCPRGHFRATTTTCSKTTGLGGINCGVCDRCTEHSDCSSRNYEYGLNKDGVCKRCDNALCTHPNYVRGDSAINYCYMSSNLTGATSPLNQICAPLYFDINIYYTNPVYQQEIFQKDIDQNQIKRGPMPWKPGFQRTKPTYPKAKLGPSSGNDDVIGKPGQLPFYRQCYNDPLDSKFQWTTNATKKEYLDQGSTPWDYDCQFVFAQDCVNSRPIYDGTGLLSKCVQCEDDSVFSNQTCVCPDGKMSIVNLTNEKNYPMQLRPNTYCLPCNGIDPQDIRWRKTPGIWVTEAFRCTNASGIEFANNPYQYLKDNQWQNCPNVTSGQQIPNENRTLCILCPNGKYIANEYDDSTGLNTMGSMRRLTCKPCPPNYYQSKAGQHQCEPKRTKCEKNMQLNLTNTNSKTEDLTCDPCKSSCDSGEIQVYQNNVNDTCNGDGVSYFGCYSWTNTVSFPMNMRTRYTKVPTTRQTSVRVEECDSSLLPNDSYFVSSLQTNTNGRNGKQCYFACLHGVNQVKQEMAHRLEKQYANAFDINLLKFLSEQTEKQLDENVGNYPGTPQKRITIPSSLRTMDETMRFDAQQQQDYLSWMKPEVAQDMGVREKCNFCNTAYKQNTFLFIDKLLSLDENVSKTLNISAQLNPYSTGLCKSHQQAYKSSQCNAPLFQALKPSIHYATNNNMKREDTRGNLVKCAYDARTNLVDYNNLRNTKMSVVLSSYNLGSSLYSEICRLVTASTIVNDSVNWTQSNNDSQTTMPSQQQQQLNNLEEWEMVGCTGHCLNEEQRRAAINMAIMSSTSRYYEINNQLFKYLMWSTWSQERSNPYIPLLSSTNCSFTCDPATSVFIQLSDFQGFHMTQMYNVRACIPYKDSTSIGLIKSICALNQMVPASTMPNGQNQQQTINDICQICNPSKEGASLLSRDSIGVQEWIQQRAHLQYQDWANTIRCRYVCSSGYFPNYALADYETKPCLSCSEVSNDLCRAQNFTTDAFFKEGPDCMTQNKVQTAPQCKSCKLKWNEDLEGDISQIYFKPGMYNESFPCLARCYEGRYHSFDRRSGASFQDNLTLDFVPMHHLICSNCSDFPKHPCNGKCQDDYFHVSNECKLCNVSGCPLPSQYREKCEAGNRTTDATCQTCPSLYLRNNGDPETKITRKYVFLNSTDIQTRKLPVVYLSNVGVLSNASAAAQGRAVQQCILACVNNYVWIDVQTNMPLFHRSSSWPLPYDHSRHQCIPCNSDFFKSALQYPNTTVLYSIWNRIGDSSLLQFKEGASYTALYQLSVNNGNLEGSCYACPYPAAQETTADSTYLCVTKPGYCGVSKCNTTSVSYGTIQETSSLSVESNTSAWNGVAVMIAKPPPRKVYYNIGGGGGGSRRLLQTMDQDMTTMTTPIFVRRIRAYKIPQMRQNDFAVCCNFMYNSEEEKGECKRKASLQFQLLKTKTGGNIGLDFCAGFSVIPISNLNPNTQVSTTAGARRRNLLQWTMDSTQQQDSLQSTTIPYIQEPDQKCPVGMFKKGFNEGGCTICPNGATTMYPYTGLTSLEGCVCQDGYKTLKRGYSSSGMFELECEECGFGWYKSDDSSIFMNDTYCLQCPQNMTTPTATSSECFCKPGYYHSYDTNLSNNITTSLKKNTVCLLCPENHFCMNGIKYACPPFSTTMGVMGISKRGYCICSNKTHYGDLKELDSQCIEIPPGIRCLDGSWDCECASGWTKVRDPYNPTKRARCITACPVGEYVTIDSTSGIASACQKCPKNTYSDKIQAIGIESCLPCPPNTYTSTLIFSEGRGAFNLSHCLCADPKSSVMECGVCPEGSYRKSQEENICMECPSPLFSNRGSTGILACMLCPKGYQTIKKAGSSILPSLLSDFQYACAPCPIGTFSARTGIACSKCPRGFTTLEMGSVSMNQCVLIASS